MASFPYFTGILKETVGLIKAGASVRETCIHADKRVEEETGKAFKKDKQLQKGKKNHTYIFVKFLQSMALNLSSWPFEMANN